MLDQNKNIALLDKIIKELEEIKKKIEQEINEYEYKLESLNH